MSWSSLSAMAWIRVRSAWEDAGGECFGGDLGELALVELGGEVGIDRFDGAQKPIAMPQAGGLKPADKEFHGKAIAHGEFLGELEEGFAHGMFAREEVELLAGVVGPIHFQLVEAVGQQAHIFG
jgi:hypothetical protein